MGKKNYQEVLLHSTHFDNNNTKNMFLNKQ